MAHSDSPWIAGIARAANDNVSYASDGEAAMMVLDMNKNHAAPASASAKAGVAAMLSQFGSLPKVKIAVLTSPLNPKTGALFDGSSAQPQGHGVCGMVLLQSSTGLSTLAQILPADMGAHASPGLASRLSTFEVLHELGHCAQAQANAQFAHPKLTAEQNKAVALGLAGNTELGEAWQESFADA